MGTTLCVFKTPDLPKDQKNKHVLASMIEIAVRESSCVGAYELRDFCEMPKGGFTCKGITTFVEKDGSIRVSLFRKDCNPVSCLLVFQDIDRASSISHILREASSAFMHQSGKIIIDVDARLESTRRGVVKKDAVPSLQTLSQLAPTNGRQFEQMVWGCSAVMDEMAYVEREPWADMVEGISFAMRSQWPEWPEALRRNIHPTDGPFSKTHVFIHRICQALVCAGLPTARFCLCECMGDSLDIDGIDGFMVLWRTPNTLPLFVPFDTTKDPTKKNVFTKTFHWNKKKNEEREVSIIRVFPEDLSMPDSGMYARRLAGYLRRFHEQKGIYFPTLPADIMKGATLPILDTTGVSS